MRQAVWVVLVVGTAMTGARAGGLQNGSFGMPTTPQQRTVDPNDRSQPPDAGQVRMQEQQAKKQNDERQRKLISDTAKLYDLAEQLKEQVGKTDKNTLSVDVVKKAEEIEKLAKSVKERMRGQN